MSSFRLYSGVSTDFETRPILNSGRRITADTSLRLAKFFGVSDRFFLDMQNDIDIRNLKMSMEKEIAEIKPIQVVAI